MPIKVMEYTVQKNIKKWYTITVYCKNDNSEEFL